MARTPLAPAGRPALTSQQLPEVLQLPMVVFKSLILIVSVIDDDTAAGLVLQVPAGSNLMKSISTPSIPTPDGDGPGNLGNCFNAFIAFILFVQHTYFY